MNSTSYLVTLLVSGLLGSVGHCLGMCGPLNLMMAAQVRKENLPSAWSFTLYHISRIIMYIIVGGIVGELGSLLGLSKQISILGGIVSIVLGLGIIFLGANYLGLFRTLNLEGASSWWNTAFSNVLKKHGSIGVVLLGALNGLLPCGLVYSALLLAASTGNPWSGMLGMTLFGLGTFPALFALDLGAGALSVRLREWMLKVAGALMIVIGLQLFLRGGAALHFWPHLHLGGLAIW